VDKYAKLGNPNVFKFPMPRIPDLDFSFSGLKTSFLYLIRDEVAKDPQFVSKHQNDLCASFQKCVISILIDKLQTAAENTGINEIAIAGGVSANSGLRDTLKEVAKKR